MNIINLDCIFIELGNCKWWFGRYPPCYIKLISGRMPMHLFVQCSRDTRNEIKFSELTNHKQTIFDLTM